MSNCLNQNGPLILSVDDDPCISRVVQLKLGDSGYRVIRAENGPDGLRQFIDQTPDVLITSVRMPGMSGIELARRCLECRGHWPFLIIVHTYQVDEGTMQWLRGTDDVVYVPKPFSPRKLLRIIDCYIRNRNVPQGVSR